MPDRLALDTNLLLLLLVGQVASEFIPKHKRLRGYSFKDFEILSAIVRRAGSLVATPSAMSEVSNLIGAGITGQLRTRLMIAVRDFAGAVPEHYAPSSKLVQPSEFLRLGLADSAWLDLLSDKTVLLTADRDLYLAALNQHATAYLFEDVRRFGLRGGW